MTLQHGQAISILQCVVAVGEGSTRLSVLLGGPSFYYWICFLQPEGVWELDVLFLVFPLFWVLWFFYDWVPCIPSFSGCFGVFMIGRVSSISYS